MNESTRLPREVLVRLDDLAPRVGDDAWIAPGAMLIGAVSIGDTSSVWYGAVLRADDEVVEIGRDSNLQDGVIAHADPGFPARIGDRVTVGHGAILHGATIEDDCIIGMHATVMNGATIGRGSIVAAGAVVRESTEVPPGSVVAGVPAAVRGGVGEEGSALIEESWQEYVEKASRHRRVARVVGPVQ